MIILIAVVYLHRLKLALLHFYFSHLNYWYHLGRDTNENPHEVKDKAH